MVMVVNKALADRYFSNEDPIGHRILVDVGAKDPDAFEIIGVVDSIRHFALQYEPYIEMYVAALDSPQTNVVIRTNSDPIALAPAVRREILAVDRDQPISNVRSMEQVVESSIGTNRFTTYVLGAFTVMALVLAMVGIYGVVAYSVTQRMHEIGLRIALGAQRSDIYKWIVGRGLVLGLIGVLVGTTAAFGLTRLMQELLYQVSVLDPLTFWLVPALFLAVTLISSYFPARRGVKTDPIASLRAD
jgi:putative ABC transport system permease protein